MSTERVGRGFHLFVLERRREIIQFPGP